MDDKLTPLELLNFVYPVLPSGGGGSGKVPLVKWVEYQSSFPTPKDIENWENTYHPTMWGIVTGKVSSIVVVDVDRSDLRAMFDAEGLSPHIRTPRGGYHYWFRHPGIPVKTKAGLLPGIDIRADGGFVNVIGKRKDGEYQTLIIPSPDTIYPWDKLPAPLREALNNNHTTSSSPQGDANWVTELMQGVAKGQRDAVCTRLAGYYLGHNLHPDIVKTTLYSFADKCTPPFPHPEVDKCVDSITNRGGDNATIGEYNTLSLICPPGAPNKAVGRQVGRQVGDKIAQNWGDLSKRFDDFMRENKGAWVDKRDLGDILETSYKDKSFQKLLLRRRTPPNESIIVNGRNPNLIKWVNRDYEETDLCSDIEEHWIGARLPLDLETRVQIPLASVGIIAGFKDAGKTAFFLELAETVLLSTKMNVWYWYNEFSEARLRIRIEDFPVLKKMQEDRRFHPVRQTDFEIKDVIHHDDCNIYDYLRRTEDFYLHSKDIDQIAKNMNNGMLWIGLQKSFDAHQGYGGIPTMWLANIYITLDVVGNAKEGIKGKATIQGAKDYSRDNPKGESCSYHSGGRHGRLYRDGIWGRG